MIEPRMIDGMELPMNHPTTVPGAAAPVTRPNATSTPVPQIAPMAFDSRTPRSIQTIQSLAVRSAGSDLNMRNAMAATIPCARLPGIYAMDTGRGAEPDSELEISGNRADAMAPQPPNQIEPMLCTAWPGQNADTNPIGTARLPNVPTTIPMPVKRAKMTT